MTRKQRILELIADLLEKSGIDIEEVDRFKRVKLYEGFYKNKDGTAHTKVDMVSVDLRAKWEAGPSWPVVQQSKPVVIEQKFTFRPLDWDDGWETAVVGPDMQIGFYRDKLGKLIPTHDPQAIDVFIEGCVYLQPNVIVLVGDNLDLPEFGKYRQHPAFSQTTQAAIDYAGAVMARLRAACPESKIVWLAGNHEERLPNYIIDNAKAAFGLRRAGDVHGWPVMSVPHLLRLDEHQIEYLPGYPANAYWINKKLRVIHGVKVNSGGSTAAEVAKSEKTSVIFGHVHRAEYHEITRPDHDGPKIVMAASPGCLARIDGVVPSAKQGFDLDGRPLTSHENWQQGFAVVTYKPGNGPFRYEHVPIRFGSAWYGGMEFKSSTRLPKAA